jgi:hypothetical protein
MWLREWIPEVFYVRVIVPFELLDSRADSFSKIIAQLKEGI